MLKWPTCPCNPTWHLSEYWRTFWKKWLMTCHHDTHAILTCGIMGPPNGLSPRISEPSGKREWWCVITRYTQHWHVAFWPLLPFSEPCPSGVALGRWLFFEGSNHISTRQNQTDIWNNPLFPRKYNLFETSL